MKRKPLFLLLAFLPLMYGLAQTTITKPPVAEVKLIKNQVIDFNQFKSEVTKIEAAIGRKMTIDERKQYLNSKIDTLLFFQYCERERIFVQDSEITAEIAKAKASVGGLAGSDDAHFEDFLRSQGIFADAKTYYRQQLLFRSYVTQRKAKEYAAIPAPSSDEIFKAYDVAKSSLVRPDTARISVIFVDFKNASPDAKARATDAIRQVAAQIKANSGRFDELMVKAFDQGSGYKGGASVLVAKTAQSETVYGSLFIDKVFKLKTGEVSDLIEGPTGMQIVRLNEFLPYKQLTFSDTVPGQQGTVLELVAQKIAAEKEAAFVDQVDKALVAELRKSATVTINNDSLNF